MRVREVGGAGLCGWRRVVLVLAVLVVMGGVRAGAQGTEPVLVADVNPGGGSSSINQGAVVDGILYFAADDGVHGAELWRTDGTAAGTRIVRDINTDGAASPAEFTAHAGRVYFTADDGVYGRELWRTDGTEAGTALVMDIHPDAGSGPTHLTAYDGFVYFAADDGVHGPELWRTDGTEAGTALFADLRADFGSYAQNLTVCGGLLFFTASDGVHGHELWKTDGSVAGTSLVKDIYVGGHASPQYLTVVGDTLFFSAVEPVNGQELWCSDGTEAGTRLVKDIRAGGNSYPMFFAVCEGFLYFSADDGVHGRELWRSDGTDLGTILVSDTVEGAFGSFPKSLTSCNGFLYYSADDGVHGREPWRSDGTDAGTVMVSNIRGIGSSEPTELFQANGLLYFQATEQVNGAEFWVSNGSEAGTVLLKDINPGVENGSPAGFIVAGGRLFFRATDADHGEELWSYELPEPDVTPPIITLLGDPVVVIEQGGIYVDAGAVATDNIDGDLTSGIAVANSVDTLTPGAYEVTYDVTDSSGNRAERVARTVHVMLAKAPVITLIGANPLDVEAHTEYVDPGFTAMDNVDGDITDRVVVVGAVDMAVLGEYVVTHNVSDSVGHAAVEVVRTVRVVDTVAPVITMLGSSPVFVEAGCVYMDAGAVAIDNHDGNLTAAVTVTSTVDASTPGPYTVSYDVHDSSGNAARRVTRIVNVLPAQAPAITLLGANPLEAECGFAFVDPGVIAQDNVDGDISGRVTVSGTVDTSTLGTYYLAYDVADSVGNAAVTVVRTVNVVDTTPPVITMNGAAEISLLRNKAYTDPGATASDNRDGDLTHAVRIVNPVNTTVVGTYYVTYDVTDSAGNDAVRRVRKVVVSPSDPRTWHVDADAMASGDGSSASPFNTISRAMSAVVAGRGDVVLVRPGEYVESVSVPAGVTLRGVDGACHTWVIAPAAGSTVVTLGLNAIVRGLTIASGGVGVSVPGGVAAEVGNCVLTGNQTGARVAASGMLAMVNNTINANVAFGVRCDPGGLLAGFRNNIMSANGVALACDSEAVSSGGFNCYFNNGRDLEGPAAFASDFAADPLHVDSASGNCHLRHDSPCRDVGDPTSVFNDLDGSRNDLGADGGPHGVRDSLVPEAVAVADRTTAPPPLTVTFSGSASDDEWGIASYSWDFDKSNGIQLNAAGPVVKHTYTISGTYVATLTVMDNSGLKSSASVKIVVGQVAPPSVTATRSPMAGPAALAVQFTAAILNPENGMSYAWDFDGDGRVDSSQQNPRHTYAVGTPAGAYYASLTVNGAGGVLDFVALPITVTHGNPEIAREIAPSPGGLLEVVRPASPVRGVALSVPAGAMAESAVVTLGGAPAGFKEPDGLLAMVETGPAGLVLSKQAGLSVPGVSVKSDPGLVQVLYFDEDEQAWLKMPGASLSLSGDGANLKITRLGMIAIAAPKLAADLNGDGRVNSIDVQTVIMAVLGTSVDPMKSDVNGDGRVDSIDIQLIIRAVLGV